MNAASEQPYVVSGIAGFYADGGPVARALFEAVLRLLTDGGPTTIDRSEIVDGLSLTLTIGARHDTIRVSDGHDDYTLVRGPAGDIVQSASTTDFALYCLFLLS